MGSLLMNTFVKKNNSRYTDALICEAQGLSALSDHVKDTQIQVPTVFDVDNRQMTMTAIASQSCSNAQMVVLGKGLALMHNHKQAYYGFDNDNYIGLNPQMNRRHEEWGSFFVTCRLLPQIEWIQDANLQSTFLGQLQKHRSKLETFLNAYCEHPSLVHGDLWSGNYLCDADQVWLIDPAVYFGDREVDIAMTEMFGGFSSAFYEAYDAVSPCSSVYAIKRDIYNLYHYLNHLNLFGHSYLSGCKKGFAAIESL